MKENVWCVFVREYSELPGLQRAGRICYSLVQAGGGLCLRAEKEQASASPVAATCTLTGVTRHTAENLLRFLYENAVEPSSLNAVVSDCLTDQLMAQQGAAACAQE